MASIAYSPFLRDSVLLLMDCLHGGGGVGGGGQVAGPYIAGGRRGQLPPPGKLNVFFLT